MPKGCDVPWWPTGCLYPVLSFFYSLQTSLVSFPALSSNDFFIWHSHWRGRMRAFPGLGDHVPLLLAGRDDGRAADAAVSSSPLLCLRRLLIHSRGWSAVWWRRPRVNMSPQSRNIGVLRKQLLLSRTHRMAVSRKVKWKSLSRVRLLAAPWTVACQAPLWNFPGQNAGVGSCSLIQGIFPTQGLNPGPLHCRLIVQHLSHQGSLIASPQNLTLKCTPQIYSRKKAAVENSLICPFQGPREVLVLTGCCPFLVPLLLTTLLYLQI